MKSACCVKLKSFGTSVVVVAVDDDSPVLVLKGKEGLSSVDDEVVVNVDADVGLGKAKFSVLEVDF